MPASGMHPRQKKLLYAPELIWSVQTAVQEFYSSSRNTRDFSRVIPVRVFGMPAFFYNSGAGHLSSSDQEKMGLMASERASFSA